MKKFNQFEIEIQKDNSTEKTVITVFVIVNSSGRVFKKYAKANPPSLLLSKERVILKDSQFILPSQNQPNSWLTTFVVKSKGLLKLKLNSLLTRSKNILINVMQFINRNKFKIATFTMAIVLSVLAFYCHIWVTKKLVQEVEQKLLQGLAMKEPRNQTINWL